MKQILSFFLLIVLSFPGKGQNITGIINAYAGVTNVNQNVFTVNSTVGFTLGDKVMVIKMKGATINNTNTASYGDSIALNQAGLYVFSTVAAISPTTLTLNPYCNFFTNSDYLQIVTIPQYTNPIVIGTLSCQPWNGTTGGILAFEADTVFMNGTISANAMGFRGGNVQGNSFSCGSTNYFSAQTAFSAEGKKGEGVADWIVGQECGRGKLTNGGGGAYAGNTGAGGGANYGTGGNGGREYSGCFSTTIFSIGAQPLAHNSAHFYLGGGGGGPQADNGNTVFPGGNGGGIIYIKANQIIGNGNNINSFGGDSPQINDEGASGGGAGGSVYLDVQNFNGPLTVNVKGGKGGSNFNTTFQADCHGPGGGGGGGIIHFSLPALPANVTPVVDGGLSGLVLNPVSTCFNTTYFAEEGLPGGVEFNFIPTPLPTPVAVNLGPDQSLCVGQSITLDAGAGFSTYLWDDLTVNQTRTVSTAGTYHVLVTNAIGCTGADTIQVVNDTSLIADFSIIKRLGCDDDTIELVNNSSGATNYIWFFGDSQSSLDVNPIHVYSNQMTYTVTLVAFNSPCADTISIPVDVSHPITANLFASGNGGVNGQQFAIDSTCILYDMDVLSTSFPVGSYDYQWNWGDGKQTNTGSTPNAKHFYTAPGSFTITLTITDTLGCSDDSSRVVFVDDLAFVDMSISDSILCVGEPILFKDSVSPFSESFEYDFADGAVLANVHNPTHVYDRDGSYIVTLTAKNLLCPDSTTSRTIIIDEYPILDLGPDTSICPGITGTIFLNNQANPAGVYEWSTGETANLIQVVEPGRFWIRAESPNAGCVTVDSIWIKRDCYLNIPNAFSPDGDGINDYFIPRDLLSSGLASFKMDIFNRWGENIYTTTTLDGRGWDGTFDGKPQNMGVYVYTLDVVFQNKVKKTFKGNVTLVR